VNIYDSIHVISQSDDNGEAGKGGPGIDNNIKEAGLLWIQLMQNSNRFSPEDTLIDSGIDS
jgi:hypothetical protein